MEGLSISKSTASVSVGSTTTLSATSTDNGTITWITSNSSVVSLSSSTSASGANITVTGVAAGTATITAKRTINGTQYSKTCTVTVTKVVSSLSKGSTSPNKTTYTAGESFDPTGLTITATYSDSTTGNVTSSVVWSPNPLTAGTTSVTGTFGGKSITITGLTVTQATEPEIIDSNSDLSVGDYVVLKTAAGVGVTGWNNNKDATVSETESEWKKFYVASASSGGFTLKDESANNFIASPGSSNQFLYGSAATCSTDSDGHLICNSRYLCKNGTNYRFYTSISSYLPFFIYKVPAGSSSIKTLSSISVYTAPSKTTYTAGEYFDPTGLVITRTYSDSTSDTYTYAGHESDFTFSPTTSTALTTSNTSVTITYGGKSCNQAITVNSAPATSITATPTKTFYVGETISASNINVTDNNSNYVNSFTFANDGYRFTYADASSGGALTSKIFTNAITSGNLTCSLTVQVQRKNYVTPSEDDYSVSYTDLPTSYQTSTTERTAASGVKFIAYNLANYSSKMQFKASSGYFQTTQSMNLKSLTINNRETNALTVYGSTDGTSFSNSITGTNDVYDLTGYTYVKVMKNGSGAAYCASLTIVAGTLETPTNIANYIMYEDTNNQCTTKLGIAITYLGNLSSSDRTTFSGSSDYVISTARTRLNAWAASQGKTIDYEHATMSNRSGISLLNVNNNSSAITLIIIISLVGTTSIGIFFYLRKKHEN